MSKDTDSEVGFGHGERDLAVGLGLLDADQATRSEGEDVVEGGSSDACGRRGGRAEVAEEQIGLAARAGVGVPLGVPVGVSATQRRQQTHSKKRKTSGCSEVVEIWPASKLKSAAG